MKTANKRIMENLKNTYCRLGPSKIQGVGVFAIRDIPKNTNPFPNVKTQNWHKIKLSEMENLDGGIKKMVSDFFGMDEKGHFLIPGCGLNGMDISFFLNTSDKPNIKAINGGANFVSVKKIKGGEELTVSYATYDVRYKNKNNNLKI